MRGTLNTFQKLLLHWREIHPLNAIHAVRLKGTGELDSLRRAFTHSCDRLGLRGVVFDLENAAYEYGHGAPPVEAMRLSKPNLASALELELNRPFPQPPYNPVRCFLHREADSQVVGLTYDHWTGDATSLMPLLGQTLCEYLAEPCPASSAPDLYPPALRHLLRRRLTNEMAARVFLQAIRTYADMRRARRVHHHDPLDLSNGYLIRPLRPGAYESLRAAAGRVDATVHDLCMAALSRSLARHLPPYRGIWRQGIGIGSVASIRPLVDRQFAEAHGVLLCYLNFVVDKPLRHDLLRLTARIARRTRLMKRDHNYLSSLLSFRLGDLTAPYIKPRSHLRFAIRNVPLCGGVSSFRLTSQNLPRPILDRITAYYRAVNTGPNVPLVVQVAKIRDDAVFGISFRTTAVERGVAERIGDGFIGELKSVIG